MTHSEKERSIGKTSLTKYPHSGNLGLQCVADFEPAQRLSTQLARKECRGGAPLREARETTSRLAEHHLSSH